MRVTDSLTKNRPYEIPSFEGCDLRKLSVTIVDRSPIRGSGQDTITPMVPNVGRGTLPVREQGQAAQEGKNRSGGLSCA